MFRDVTKTLQDLRHLDWTERATTSGTAGCFLKARETVGAGTWYYKLSCYDSYRGIYGHECVNEIVASRLMGILGVEHLKYRLVHGLVSIDGVQHETWLSRSKSFRQPGERKMALDTFYDLHKEAGESPLEFCERLGWGPAVQRIMLVDYLIANRDRHGANIEVLQDQQGSRRLAPVFDSGLSLVFSCYGDEDRVRAFDPLDDVQANNFLGTRSLEENVQRFVDPSLRIGALEERHQAVLLRSLEDVLPGAHREKIWQTIWKRWQRFEDIRDS